MTSVAATGTGGFLGWHLRVYAHTHLGVPVAPVPLGPDILAAQVAQSCRADDVIHAAGVNRGSEAEVRDGNVRLAQQLADGLRRSGQPPARLVFANSTQAGNGTPYGDGKAAAAEILHSCAAEIGAVFYDVRLPNLFGEHGRPHYNSVVATFAHQVAHGDEPVVENDKELDLLHAQQAARALVSPGNGDDLGDQTERISVDGVRGRLVELARVYATGDIPDLASDFDLALFNTYRSQIDESQWPRALTRNEDARGSFFESVRCRGTAGQTSFSSTVPGAVRGEHYHLHKVERFVVLSGAGRICLRRLFDSRIVSFDVSGDRPVAIDMPTMWAHNISNIGSGELYTMFWANELFSPEAPDTYREKV